jgi:hypothetical protein
VSVLRSLDTFRRCGSIFINGRTPVKEALDVPATKSAIPNIGEIVMVRGADPERGRKFTVCAFMRNVTPEAGDDAPQEVQLQLHNCPWNSKDNAYQNYSLDWCERKDAEYVGLRESPVPHKLETVVRTGKIVDEDALKNLRSIAAMNLETAREQRPLLHLQEALKPEHAKRRQLKRGDSVVYRFHDKVTTERSPTSPRKTQKAVTGSVR